MVALSVLLMMATVPAKGVAQNGGDVTCGWCVMDGDLVDEGSGWSVYDNVEHKFPGGGNPDRVFRTIPVLPETRDRLKATVALHATAITE